MSTMGAAFVAYVRMREQPGVDHLGFPSTVSLERLEDSRIQCVDCGRQGRVSSPIRRLRRLAAVIWPRRASDAG